MAPLIQVRQVVKDYRGLRPLRVQALDVEAGQSIALLGFDLPMAEVLVNLLTGAALPDAGSVAVFGEGTDTIRDVDGFVRTLDQFGLISERAVMLDELTAEQNLALPLSLTVETMSAEVRQRVAGLAAEVGLSEQDLRSRLGSLTPLARQRVRLGRALALDPRVLLAEHPNAPLSGPDTLVFARQLAAVIDRRGLSSIVMTADATFARAVSSTVLTLHPATGALKSSSGWRRWLP